MKKKTEYILGFILIIVLLVGGRFILDSTALYFRLIIGLALGYTLTRSFFGFAGSVNRAYKTGSTKLMRVLMWMFAGSAVLTAGVLMGGNAADFDLWVNPINWGLLAGGILFGFGMTFSVCCASGVLTDIITGFFRAFITLIFFGLGVFLGFPLQATQSWVSDSWISTETFATGVFFPDLFKWDGLGGYLGAIVLTLILAGIVVYISKKIEDSYKKKGKYTGVDSEIMQVKPAPEEKVPFVLFSQDTYDRIFVKAWSLRTGATVITGIFVLLMTVTKAGWGASTPYGQWFGKLLMLFGVSPESLSGFSGKPVQFYTDSLLSNGVNIQNFGIIFGTLVALLLSGSAASTIRQGFKITFLDGVLYAFGGFFMGFGTRLANGCNVGALYTPIANFSLSGWIFLVVMVVGGILGNIVAKKVNKSCPVNFK